MAIPRSTGQSRMVSESNGNRPPTIRLFHPAMDQPRRNTHHTAAPPGTKRMTTTTHTKTWAKDMAYDIEQAKRAILMTSLSLFPTRTLKLDTFSRWWLALADAVKRGVALQIALPAPHIAYQATMRNDIAAAMIREIGGTAIMIPATNLLHAKTCLIDASVAWVGSGNMTPAAMHDNRECYIRTNDTHAVADLAGFIAQVFTASAK
jgi:phosphatidylserine/phosphatidylglycerophosphate/cardiolipin synthase-like enzyme